MKEIQLTQAKSAIVDDEYFQELSAFKWYFTLNKQGKPRSVLAVKWNKLNKKNETILMHRYIMGATKGQIVDHINGNILDNRKSNLRFCSISQNAMNSRKTNRSNLTSKLKGVSLDRSGKRIKPWRAFIKLNKKSIYLGNFKTEIEAHNAYCEAAKKHFGHFARAE